MEAAYTNSEPARGTVHVDGFDTAVVSERLTREVDRRIARERAEALLDEALGETFPASDPIAITPRKQSSK